MARLAPRDIQAPASIIVSHVIRAPAASPSGRHAPDTAGTRTTEVLFIDPGVNDIDMLLGGLRSGVEAIVLDRTRPAARQMAVALAGRQDIEAIHVIAHGGPGRVRFASGDWSAETLEDEADDLAAIGEALVKDGEQSGDLRLWSCNAGAGAEGTVFVAGPEQATGTDVVVARGRVGAVALGGGWRLHRRSLRVEIPPPLSQAGQAAYPGVLDDYMQIDTHGAPVTLETGVYSLVARIDGKTDVIGQFSVLKGLPHNMLVKVATARSNSTVYAGPDGNLGEGQMTTYDSQGNYSQQAALALLDADGAQVAVRPLASPTPGPRPTLSARVGDRSQSAENSRKTR